MTPVSLCARLRLCVSSNRALSLPQSSPQKLKGLTAPSSEGAEAAPPQSTDLALLSKFGVNAITGRRYNPSVAPTIKMCPPCGHIYYSLFVLQNVPAWRAHFRVNFRKRRNFVSPICVRCRKQPLSAGRDYREQDPRLRQRSQEHFLLCKPACRSLWKPACRCCAAGFRRR